MAWLPDALTLAGLGSIVLGAFLLATPLGFLALGAALLLLAFVFVDAFRGSR